MEATKKLLVRSGEQWAVVVARKAHVADRVRDALQRLRLEGKVRKIEQIRAQWESTI